MSPCTLVETFRGLRLGEDGLAETTFAGQRLIVAHDPVRAKEQTARCHARNAELEAMAEKMVTKLDAQDEGQTARGRRTFDRGAYSRFVRAMAEAELTRFIKEDRISWSVDEATIAKLASFQHSLHDVTMRISIYSVVWMSLFVGLSGLSPALADTMRFYRASTGGNCVTCTWIAAEGVIEANSYERFLEFLEKEKLRDKRGINVHLNSPGGNLLGGVRLGLSFRQQQVNTVISSAAIRDTYADGTAVVGEPLPSECSSACAFAFAGGVSRFASKTTPAQEIGFQSLGRLGVHQFYDKRSLGEPSQRLFSGEERIDDQRIIALLLSYLSDMGVSAELLQLAAKTPPSAIHYLSESELRRTRADNRMVREVFISGYHNGVAITEIQYKRQEADYRLEVYCERGAMRVLASIDYRGFYDVAAHDRWDIFDHMFLRDGVSVRVISEEFNDGPGGGTSLQVLFEFEKSPLSELVRRKAFIFDDNTSRYASNAARALSFVLPKDFDGLFLLPQTCFGG